MATKMWILPDQGLNPCLLHWQAGFFFFFFFTTEPPGKPCRERFWFLLSVILEKPSPVPLWHFCCGQIIPQTSDHSLQLEQNTDCSYQVHQTTSLWIYLNGQRVPSFDEMMGYNCCFNSWYSHFQIWLRCHVSFRWRQFVLPTKCVLESSYTCLYQILSK